MSNIQRRGAGLPAVPAETATALEAATTQAIAAFGNATTGGSVIAALEVAKAIEDLRVLFDQPEIKARIVALQDTPLGFRTDKDPRVVNRKTNQPNVPYDYAVVREAAIEAGLRGLQLVGNQFNIISGRFYATKEGFEALIRKAPGVSGFRPIIGVPGNKPGGVLVECEATWQQGGAQQNLKVTIPVKSDDYSSADQLIGKATRKFLRRCYEMMTGSTVPEGDTGDDAVVVEAKPAPAAPQFRRATDTGPAAAPTPAPTPVVEAEVVPTTTAATTQAVPAAPATTPQEELAAFVVAGGHTFDEFQAWARHQRFYVDELTGFDEVPVAVANRLNKSKSGVLKSIAAHKGGSR
ncbi:MAG: hypothetical protein EBR82_69460 [Caulobacteraceae bacterium]|nr:hypothetical protein [Caulobacteraceae bacterium]